MMSINVLCGISAIVNTLAIVALFRSKRLSYNIRIFSVNLAVTDVMASIAGIFVIVVGGNITSDIMADDCLQKLLGIYVITWMYFVSSFMITSMGVDRFASILYPFRYLEVVANRKERIVRACILFWLISLGVVVSFDIENGGRLYLCISGEHKEETIFFGLQHSKLRFIGCINLCILFTNIFTYSAIILHIWKKRKALHQHGEYSTLVKLLAFTVAYTFLHGPYNLTTIVIGLIVDNSWDYSFVIRTDVVISSLAIVVDPILYVWRYTDCRIQMMMLLCHCNPAQKDKWRRKQNSFYGTYGISTVTRSSTAN